MSIIPVDNYRVGVTPKPGEPGTDYINATFMPVIDKLPNVSNASLNTCILY